MSLFSAIIKPILEHELATIEPLAAQAAVVVLKSLGQQLVV